MSSRGKKLKINMITGIIQELVAVACGLILPRFVLSFFGSSYNGLVNSITQIMAFSVVLRSGLGAVTNAALFKPLAENDFDSVSGIMVATKNFMNKVAALLIVFIFGFAFIYPLIVADEFSYWSTFFLVLIIGASSFVENMFSIKYKILLQADQKYYVQTVTAVIAQVLSTGFSVLLMFLGFGIHVVRIGTVLGFMTTPFMLKLYVDKKYKIDWTVAPDDSAIKTRWDAFIQQFATIVNNNIPTIVITVMLSMKELSVYSLYNMVTRNLVQLFSTCLAGVKATFGNMLALGEHDRLQQRFENIELLVYICSTIFFVTAAIMITPFVLVYTKDVVNDVNYNRYWLGTLISMVSMMYIIRIPYQLLVEADGIFKETRNGSFLEIVLNIVVSVIFILLFGVTGIVVGGFVAALVRTTQFAVIACKKILNISVLNVIKKCLLYFILSIGIITATYYLDCFDCSSFLEWILKALVVFCSVTAVVILTSLIFQFKQCKNILMYFLKKKSKEHKYVSK